MAMPQLIQGSWEEISARAEQFKGRKDLMLIVPGDTANPAETSDRALPLSEALRGRTGLVSFEPSDLSEDTGRKFADLLVEKHQNEQK
jgi:hypothetical protein